VKPFFVAGAFPVYNTDFNFSSTQPDKFQSEDKWLFAIQGGSDVQIRDDLKLKMAAAFYYFENIEGKVSSPMDTSNPNLQGDTDDSRPAFAQHGNTYIPLRQSNGTETTADQYQYFGLATPFHEVAVTGRLDYSHFDPLHLWATAELVKNVALDKSAINNNGPTQASGPVNNTDGAGNYDGGDTGWIVALYVGSPALDKRWDWNAYMNYRYVESDATVDGFTDSDFGGPSLAGTNLQGYTLGGNLALSSRVWVGARWMSADSIAGPSMKSDVFQIDLNARF
jgi:Putative porin